MSNSYKFYSDTKDIMKKYVNATEGAIIYGISKSMARKQGVTEQLKAEDMMRWVGLMNNIRACADEIVLNDIVYS